MFSYSISSWIENCSVLLRTSQIYLVLSYQKSSACVMFSINMSFSDKTSPRAAYITLRSGSWARLHGRFEERASIRHEECNVYASRQCASLNLQEVAILCCMIVLDVREKQTKKEQNQLWREGETARAMRLAVGHVAPLNARLGGRQPKSRESSRLSVGAICGSWQR